MEKQGTRVFFPYKRTLAEKEREGEGDGGGGERETQTDWMKKKRHQTKQGYLEHPVFTQSRGPEKGS